MLKKTIKKIAIVFSLCCFSFVLAFLFFTSHSAPLSHYAPRKNIIDLHCHVAGIGSGGSGIYLSSQMSESFKLEFYMEAFGVSLEELAEKGDALVVERLSERIAASKFVSKALVLALDGVVTGGELDYSKTEVYV
ncbi:hypothetical protein BVY02_01100, partial [bacterium J17]